MLRICLVNMPFASLRIPSLALSQLETILNKFGQQVAVEVLYLNQDFGRFMGPKFYEHIAEAEHNTALGEWFFRQAAFPELPDNDEKYFRRFFPQHSLESDAIRQRVKKKRGQLNDFMDKLIAQYNLAEADIVGFTSMFSQNVACFGLARKIKEKNPKAIVVMGGANCESPMGQEIAMRFRQIDFVFSGPALISFQQFVQSCLDGRRQEAHRIKGVFSYENCSAPLPQARLGETKPVSFIGDELSIDETIPLDYGPFLNRLEANFPNNKLSPILLFETSRGCWWGEKAHCTFCGLNGATMGYRAMSPERALRQFETLFKYASRCSYFQCVDNILDEKYLEEVFPRLETPSNVGIFYEVKADLTAEDFKTLAKAGVNSIQPGVESLATSTLKLMRKGTNVFQNLSLLKNCVTYDIKPSWNLLVGFPGEGEEVYKKYVQDLPLLRHLPPPSGVFPVRFDRYSPYFVQAAHYGLDLHPIDYYELIYPFDEEVLSNLAYYFSDRNLNSE